MKYGILPHYQKQAMKKIKRSARSNGNKVGVLLEHIDSKVDLVVEGHRALDKKIIEGHRNLKEFQAETNYKFDTVIDELRLIRNELKEKIGRDEFLALENRVIRLEKSIRHR